MPLKVELATAEDFPAIVKIESEAYRPSKTAAIFFPNGRSPESLRIGAETQLKQAREDPSVRNVKVIDTDRGDELVACARWFLYYGDNAQYIQTDLNKKNPIPGEDTDAMRAISQVFKLKRVNHIGKVPHCYLQNLTTSPQHQRRGAATLLIKWGCDIAQENKVPAYVQSSIEGHQIYIKCGFDDVYQVEFDLERIGKEGIHRNWLMVKKPQNID